MLKRIARNRYRNAFGTCKEVQVPKCSPIRKLRKQRQWAGLAA